MATRKKKGQAHTDLAQHNRQIGEQILGSSRIFSGVVSSLHVVPSEICPRDGWAVVSNAGSIYVHPTRLGDPHEWAYVFAHCTDTVGELVQASSVQEAKANAAKREQRVLARGTSLSQSTRRMRFNATAVAMCCRWTFWRPR